MSTYAAAIDYPQLYRQFDAPIAAFNCGDYCAPHNPHGVPFCCDSHYAVPAVYVNEWAYLQVNTDLWHRWQGRSLAETRRLQEDTPEGMLLLECKGHPACQRSYRSISCRAFPFFPYVTRDGWFSGMSYYWQFEDLCWVVSNLAVVTSTYRNSFKAAFDEILFRIPGELQNYRQLSSSMRRVFSRKKRAIPLLHRNGKYYKVTPRNGRMRRVDPQRLPQFGPYRS
jgi:hypothetical protein